MNGRSDNLNRLRHRVFRRLAASLLRGWEGFSLFLEVVGLRRERRESDHAAQLARFRLYHTEFRKLLSANNSFLETLAEIEQKLQGKEFIDRTYVKRKVVRVVADIHNMVESINVIAGDRYAGLRRTLDRITASLSGVMEPAALWGPTELVLDLSEIYAIHTDLVGGKMANLGEIRNAVGLATPDGFAVTTEGYRLLVEEGGIRSWVQTEHMGLISTADAAEVSHSLQEQMLKVSVPSALERAMLAAYDRLVERAGTPRALAVRSSAVGEDSHLSFAGQFDSVLNVAKEELPAAYRQVLASLYSPEAVHYRLLHGVPGESAEMAVGVIAMVDAVSSGVVFSRDPGQPESPSVLIQAVRGLGVTLADGRASPEIIKVSREGSLPEVSRIRSEQTSRIVSSKGSGVTEEALTIEEAREPCITDQEARQLARWALTLEDHFRNPQDIEWAVTAERELFLLQSRPLRIITQSLRASQPVPNFTVLLSGGDTGCPGVGTGPAVHMDEDGDLDAFPKGGVLVARRSSPKFVRLMAKAQAIITDAGGVTGHMASLARELRVPTLLNTRTATQAIPEGVVVTVDAGSGFVYQGAVSPLHNKSVETEETSDATPGGALSPDIQVLARAAQFIVPLNLIDPASSNFTEARCETLHDMARYIHEKSYHEMFGMGEQLGDFRASSYHLDVSIPIDLYIVDLGGGLKETPKTRKTNTIKLPQIASIPLTALLKGMLHERIPRSGPRFIDLRGLFSVMMEHAARTPEQESSFQNPSYAIVSEWYLNYTARLGYHLNVVDTYCSESPNKNYITFLFRGGAADLQRRSRRASAVAGILRENGFSVNLKQDTVNARLSKTGIEETKAALEMVGRLLQFFRQMDAAMTSDEHASLFQQAFLRGDYDLSEMSDSADRTATEKAPQDAAN